MWIRSARQRAARLAAALTPVLAVALPAGAEPVPGMYWTSVGSAGIVDEADISFVKLDQGHAFYSGLEVRTVRVRYNVVAVDGLAPHAGTKLSVRYRANEGQTRVVVKLRRVNLATGADDEVLVFNSDHPDLDPIPWGFATKSVQSCSHAFDFVKHAYYVEAQLTRTVAAAPWVLSPGPAVAALQIAPDVCLR